MRARPIAFTCFAATAYALAPSCGGKAVVDPPDGAGGFSASSASSGNGGTGGTTSSGTAGTGGTTSSGTGGTGGTSPGCASCYDMLTDPNVGCEDMCPSSMVLYDALAECACAVCATECATECADKCSHPPSTGQCYDCVMTGTGCVDEVDACLADG